MQTMCRVNWKAREEFISPRRTRRAQRHESKDSSSWSSCPLWLKTASAEAGHVQSRPVTVIIGRMPRSALSANDVSGGTPALLWISTHFGLLRPVSTKKRKINLELTQSELAESNESQPAWNMLKHLTINDLRYNWGLDGAKPVKVCQSKRGQSARGQAHSRTLRAVRPVWGDAAASCSAMAFHRFSLGFLPRAFRIIQHCPALSRRSRITGSATGPVAVRGVPCRPPSGQREFSMVKYYWQHRQHR